MTITQQLMLHTSFYAITAVVVIFGTLAPWYRTWAGTTLFFAKVSMWCILFAIAFDGPVANVIETIAYPLTTVVSIMLLAVMINTQTRLKKRVSKTAEVLFDKRQKEN